MLRAAIFAGGPSTVAVLLDIHHTPWFDHTRLANHDMSAIVTHCDCDAAHYRALPRPADHVARPGPVAPRGARPSSQPRRRPPATSGWW